MQNILFDKFVNLTLTDSSGKETKIVTPKTGRKPSIQVSGSAIQSNILPSVSVRMVNLYTPTPLTSFTGISIEAGYYNSNISSTTLRGNLNDAGVGWVFQESPSPDGITNFNFMVGDYGTWTSANCSVHYPAGSGKSVHDLLTEVVKPLGLTVQSGTSIRSMIWDAKLDWDASVSGFVQMIANSKKFVVNVWGSELLAYKQSEGYSSIRVVKKITYMSSPPQRQSPVTISFVAPWRPDIRCGDLIEIDPQYAKMTYGGSLTSSGKNEAYCVSTMEFDFSTSDNTNSMRVFAIMEGAEA